MKSRKLAVLALLVGSLTFGASSALAGGNGATTFTQNDHGATDSFIDVVPCTSTPAVITITYNDVFHGTINKNGSWFTGTMTGTFVATTLTANPVIYTGHFQMWFGDENNKQNDVEHATANIHGTGSDGSTISFHENAQAAMNANGVVTVSFDKTSC